MPVLLIFILESIGTQELILVGIVALIVFGPRKLPQMAKKLGGMMRELRKVSGEFRETWEREASIEDLKDEFRLDGGTPKTEKNRRETVRAIPREQTADFESIGGPGPEIREVSRDEFDKFSPPAAEHSAASMDPDPPAKNPEENASDKRNWL
ncbi:MAG: twin-arginine translocase subunit TatB [Acidobacteria bacterium]|nr:MAG: twin-arginine translocase subunit TatB [Acidobacteriota bacterium]REJ98393.1 MAG: twin-arginine translocase subunit TatB [Acidobacteriota bacterium]REK17137.1 MAG: twin-arginine translocase subunit TatB [Acidobacteriota bacterium]REK43047.1 MAG: twin-arginine translocase subunit TatB [Acidobacteriota bacterium]